VTTAQRFNLFVLRLGLAGYLLLVAAFPPLRPTSPDLAALWPLHGLLGALLLLGLFTRPAALALAAGYAALVVSTGVGEIGNAKNLAVVGAALALAIAGPGLRALDLRANAPAWLAAQPGRKALRSSHLALRVGVASVFLANGWGKFVAMGRLADELQASGAIPAWPIVGEMSPRMLVLWIGTGELAIGWFLLFGLLTKITAIVAMALLLLYFSRLGLLTSLMVKDLVILAQLVALAVVGSEAWGFDGELGRMQRRSLEREAARAAAKAAARAAEKT